MTDVERLAAIEAELDRNNLAFADVRWLLARLHEVEAERKQEVEGLTRDLIDLNRRHAEVEAERDKAQAYIDRVCVHSEANALSPTQRAVLKAAVKWREDMSMMSDLDDAVTALLESER